jgi:hypothetical protein
MLVIALVAGCSFRPGVASGPGGDSGPQGDGTQRDAPADARLVDACDDSDGDGVCNAVDDWPCGAKPAALATSVVDMPTGAVLTMDTIDVSGQGQMIVAAPGATLKLDVHFTLVDKRCQECIDQLEVGWMQAATGPRSGCVWDDRVPNPSGVDQTVKNFTITAPAVAGAYDLRTNIGQNTACGSGPSWWDGEVPPASSTIALLCVH